MQPSPVGALCAVHLDRPAQAVCARCGNFMCSECTEPPSAECAACRALTTGGFAHDANADLGTLFGAATSAFQRDWLMCLVGMLILFGCSLAGGLVSNLVTMGLDRVLDVQVDPAHPFGDLKTYLLSLAISQGVAMVVAAPFQGIGLLGLYRMMIDMLEGRRADVARMFSQLHLLPRFVVLQYVLNLVSTVPMLGFSALAGLGAFRAAKLSADDFNLLHPDRLANGTTLALGAAAAVATMVVFFVLGPVVLFAVPELVASQCSVGEALARAWVMGSGQRWRLVGYMLVSTLVMLAGMVACLVGVIPAAMLVYLLILALFLALRRSAGYPAPAR